MPVFGSRLGQSRGNTLVTNLDQSRGQAPGTPFSVQPGAVDGITFVNSSSVTVASGTTFNIPVPSGLAAGDLMVFEVIDFGGSATITLPGTITSLASGNGALSTSHKYAVGYRWATGSESAYTVNFGATTWAIGVCYVLRGADNATAPTLYSKVDAGAYTTTLPPATGAIAHSNDATLYLYSGINSAASGVVTLTFPGTLSNPVQVPLSSVGGVIGMAWGTNVSAPGNATASSALDYCDFLLDVTPVTPAPGSGQTKDLPVAYERDTAASGSLEVGQPAPGWANDGATNVVSTDFALTGTQSVKITPSGIDDYPGIESPYWVPTVGESYTAHAWVYAPSTLSQQAFIQMDFENSSHVDISQPSSAGTTLTAGVWTELTVTATAPSLSAFQNVQPNLNNIPLASDVYYVDRIWVVRNSDGQVVFSDDFDHSLGRAHSRALPVATEAETAQTFGATKRRALPVATETDTAVTITRGTAGPNPATDTATGTDTATLAAALTGTDTATATDAATMSATAAASDTASVTEVASVARTSTATDTGTGTDSGSVAASLSAADTATAANAASVSTTPAVSDSATATDAASVAVTPTVADTATATDSASVPSAAMTATETATGVDTASVARDSSAADTATVMDSASVTVPAAVSDSATAVDSASVSVALSAADTATAANAVSLTANLTGTETATGTEAVTVVGGAGATDTATGTDAASLAAAVPASDTAHGVDSATALAPGIVSASDTATATDSASVTSGAATGSDIASSTQNAAVSAALVAGDTGTATEAASVSGAAVVSDTATSADTASTSVNVTASDSATATDTASASASVAKSASDSATATDSAYVTVIIDASDTGQAVDSATVGRLISATDNATAADLASISATVAAQDFGTASDLASVVADDTVHMPPERTTHVWREDRTTLVGAEDRTTRIPAEIRSREVVP